MNWIFNPGNNLYVSFPENDKAVVNFKQVLRFSGHQGENVLLLERKGQDWFFTQHYIITAINEKPTADGGAKDYEIRLDLVQDFKEERRLEDFMYSMRIVRDFDKPTRHFGRKYNQLLENEFRAIVADRIYYERTVLGTVLNAMNPDHLNAFIAFLATEQPELLKESIDIEEALKFLAMYLEFAVAKPARYLQRSAQILGELVGEEITATVSLTQEGTSLRQRKGGNLSAQAGVVAQYLPSFTNIEFPQEHTEGPSFVSGENGAIGFRLGGGYVTDPAYEFKKTFKDEGLPITKRNL